MKNTNILNSVRISLMTVIIILCSLITIPAPVPFTMQTFGIYAAVLIIGSKKAFVATLLYLLMGLAGLPVFSGFASGAGYMAGPTGGYLLGFLLCPLVCLLFEIISKKPVPYVPLLCAGTILCYVFGTLWFALNTVKAGNFAGIPATLAICVLPYIIPDAIKLFAAYHISKKLKPILSKTNKD